MTQDSWTIRGRRVVLPDGVRPASITIRNGIIREVGSYDVSCNQDAGEMIVMPGLVDTHVHINEPGRTHWEGFANATRAAAGGGITTVIEMPLNSIPATTSVAAMEQKVSAAAGQCWIDVGFWGGVVPGNVAEIRPLCQVGCFGFKCFLASSGVEEFEQVGEDVLRDAMPALARMGAVLLVHAELEDFLAPVSDGQRNYASYMNSRPSVSEKAAIQLVLRLCRETECRVHIVHLSSADALEMLRKARAEHLPVTVETCPHYLAISAEHVPDGATEFKCAPPIRDAANREALWQGLREGDIDMIVSDHSPCPVEMKCKESGDFAAAWGGIASLQLTLPVVWTEARKRGFSEVDIVRWMASAPAMLAGLAGKKGAIAAGHDADIVLWDPDEEFIVDPENLHHRLKLTPYAGRRLHGVVKKTYLRGCPVTVGGDPHGRVLRRDWHSADNLELVGTVART